MTTTWRMVVVIVSVLLMATSAWPQEKPRLGFKDIYLGMPREDVKPIIEKGCKDSAETQKKWLRDNTPQTEDIIQETVRRNLTYCLKQGESELRLPPTYSYVGSIFLGDVRVDLREDKVEAIYFDFKKKNYEALRAAFIEKYGPPTSRTSRTWQNKLGASFVGEMIIWHLRDGVITMNELSDRLDIGSALIASEAYVDLLTREKKSRAKKDAEGL